MTGLIQEAFRAAVAAGRRAARQSVSSSTGRPRGLSWIPALTLGLFLGPILAGLAGTLLPAFGVLPVLGATEPGLHPWRALAAAPGVGGAVAASLVSGIGSTLLALLIAMAAVGAAGGTRAARVLRAGLAPLLALPHAAFAIGFAFLAAPSGWIVRLLSPWATGWTYPPDIALVQDPGAIALTLALALKEAPFLVLMLLAALGQVPAGRTLTVARCMGYGPVQAWLKAVLPLVWPQMRLPVYAVLAYSLSVVDMAMVLGPTTPPTLAVLVLRWFGDPDLTLRLQAAAGACLQLLLVVGAIAGLRMAEAAIGRLARPWLVGGARGGPGRAAQAAGAAAAGAVLAAAIGAVLALAVWSLALRWRFPDMLPAAWSLDAWSRALPGLARPLANTLAAGAAATVVALALALGCLEHERRAGVRPAAGGLWLLYLPLLVPQVGFLFGVQVLLVSTGLDGTWPALVWSHLLFVLPYVFLSMADPWRSLDERYDRAAACLGARPARVFWRVRLPLLRRVVLGAAAIGFSVSVAQYLPTVFAGAGRLPTLTTEAVALAAGSDRRVLAVTAFAQAVLPLAGFALALALGRRRAMRRWMGRAA
ncbi:ABC transporter permease [Arenibaculum pallidiluteum]|uniref:ABC transporter permease n=1 Tax=Arenibaculum pallidiluteum TaxID=2812559 RepID=UPI001A967FF2|nr:ABC transporter permease subunit [Arenibaculum pallidiluteum]